MSATAYPLTWPETFPRARSREKGAFRTTLSAALKNVKHSLALFASDSGKTLGSVVISSNVTLGVDRPADPGVAIWFVWDGISICIAVDRYTSVEANLQAVHHILEARRTELRHGTLALVRATFQGFTALPAPAGELRKRHWREVLELAAFPHPSSLDIQEAYHRLSKRRHPDVAGGSNEAMAELNRARIEATKEIVGTR